MRILKTKKGNISQGYKAGIHNGIDIINDDYVVAHSDGVVYALRKNARTNTSKAGIKDYGNYCILKHENGYYTLYAHLKYNSININLGDKVKKGDTIGYMGNTGYSFGTHLHFEVRKDMKWIDPTSYIDGDLPKQTKYGYIASKYLNTLEKETITEVNVRSLPSTNSSILSVISKNNKVKIIKENYKDANGYIWDKVEY